MTQSALADSARYDQWVAWLELAWRAHEQLAGLIRGESEHFVPLLPPPSGEPPAFLARQVESVRAVVMADLASAEAELVRLQQRAQAARLWEAEQPSPVLVDL